MMIFSLRASSHAGIWLDRRRHVRRTAAGTVSRRLSAQTHAPEHDVRKENETTGTHAVKLEDNRWHFVAVFVSSSFFLFFSKAPLCSSPTAAEQCRPPGAESLTTRRTKEESSTHRETPREWLQRGPGRSFPPRAQRILQTIQKFQCFLSGKN